MSQYEILPDSFAHTSPYGGCWLEHFYRRGGRDVFGEKVKTESHMRRLLARFRQLPELMIMGNFVVERHGVQSLCRELGTNTICAEDGFFPHYETLHADPLGFCWESSLSRMVFRGVGDRQRDVARRQRAEWLNFTRHELPPGLKPPYVVWPLQLIGDRVNRWDLNVTEWSSLLTHFRACLPPEFQLVVKPHPRAKTNDEPGRGVAGLPNTLLLDRPVDLKSLIERSCGIAGANSTVLLEARLMFHKPTYAYARGWFSHHTQLVMPVQQLTGPRELNRCDYLHDNSLLRTQYLDDYADWFLYQLLVRQRSRADAEDWPALRAWAARLSYASYVRYGDEIFA